MITTNGCAMTLFAIQTQRDRRPSSATARGCIPSTRRVRSSRPPTDSELTRGPRMPSSAGRKVMA